MYWGRGVHEIGCTGAGDSIRSDVLGQWVLLYQMYGNRGFSEIGCTAAEGSMRSGVLGQRVLRDPIWSRGVILTFLVSWSLSFVVFFLGLLVS